MKSIIVSTLLLIFSNFMYAQQSPQTPTTPSTTTSTSSNYSRSVTKNNQENFNLSISISDSNGSYRFRASYDKAFDAQVKEVLVKQFGKESLNEKASWLSWLFAPGNDEVYEIQLSSGNLRMKLNKSQADDKLQEKFTHTGERIKTLLSAEEDDR